MLGSNLFNLLGVIGVAALIKPIPVPDEILQLDLWLMALATIVTLILLCIGTEVIPVGQRAAEAATAKHGFELSWTDFDWSCQRYAHPIIGAMES